jgi:hypothetical protein
VVGQSLASALSVGEDASNVEVRLHAGRIISGASIQPPRATRLVIMQRALLTAYPHTLRPLESKRLSALFHWSAQACFWHG